MRVSAEAFHQTNQFLQENGRRMQVQSRAERKGFA